MLTRKQYSEAINSEKNISQDKIIEFEEYIKHSKQYQPYISPLNEEIVNSYDHEISFLNSLTEKNESQQNALNRSNEITNIISFKEQKEKQNQANIEKQESLKLIREKRAGYMNASILIFIVTNLGLFLASLLIILN